MSKHVHHVTPVAPQAARGLVARVYAQIEGDLGIVPEPFLLHSPAPDILAGAWSIFRESLLAGRARRGEKEAVAAAVSAGNRCPWCVDAHTMMLHAAGEGAAVRAILRETNDHAVDRELRALIRWASATRTPDAAIVADPPFPAQVAAEMIGTAITFHYLNRPVTALLSETFLPRSAWVQRGVRRIAGCYFSNSVRKTYPPGASLAALPEAALPPDLAWAAPAPAIAGAFARFAATVERAGEAALAADVRALVRDRVQSWRGADPGPSRQWVEDAVGALEPRTQPAGRLALLAALAPYQLDETVIRAFRADRSGDSDLVAALAWSSFTAARRIGAWLHSPALIQGASPEPSSAYSPSEA